MNDQEKPLVIERTDEKTGTQIKVTVTKVSKKYALQEAARGNYRKASHQAQRLADLRREPLGAFVVYKKDLEKYNNRAKHASNICDEIDKLDEATLGTALQVELEINRTK